MTSYFQFAPVEDLREETDFVHRRWMKCWWLGTQRNIMKILAKHESTYVEGEEYVTVKGYHGTDAPQ